MVQQSLLLTVAWLLAVFYCWFWLALSNHFGRREHLLPGNIYYCPFTLPRYIYYCFFYIHFGEWIFWFLPGYICNFYSTVIIAKVQLLQYKVLNCNWKSNCSDRLKGANVCSNSLQLSNYVILWNFYYCNVAGPGFCQLHHNVYLADDPGFCQTLIPPGRAPTANSQKGKFSNTHFSHV